MKVTKRTIYNVGDFDLTFEPIEDTISIKKTKKGYTIKYLIQDIDSENPRAWDNFGTMVCFHSRYDLGDKTDLNSNMFSGWEELKKYLIEEKKAYIILPLYMLDHSGITIKTSPFGGLYGRWDSGQIGFIYATKEDIKKNYIAKRVTEKLKKRAISLLETEIDTYDKWGQGDVYCIVREEFDKNKEQIEHDIVGGYIGYEYSLKALKTDI